ncbi:MAG: TIGR02556 family CRISPR-associated protein [Methanobacteriaceae archaeon]|jgi:CRISPR-associated protein Csh1
MYHLGKFVTEKEKSDILELFLDKQKLVSKTKKILVINLIKRGDCFVYDRIIDEKLSKDKIIKYLYKGGPSRGVDFTPSSLIPKDAVSTFESRILRWFDKQEDSKFLENIHQALLDSKETIISNLKDKYSSIDGEDKKNVLLTISIQDESEFDRKYIGDYDIFRKIVLEDSKERYYHLKSIGESKGHGKCYLCDEETEVYGFVPNAFGFSFSNADKKGNVPGFIQTDQWKQVPICGKCAIFLEAGKKFVEEYLSFNMFNIRYFVIPQFLFKGEVGAFEEFYNRITYSQEKSYENRLIDEEDKEDEDSLYNAIKGMKDVLEFKFLFYGVKGGGKFIDILNYVESVLPSWIKEMHDAQVSIRKDILFQEDNLKPIFGNAEGNFVSLRISQKKKVSQNKIGITEHKWYAGFLRDFFPYNTHNKYFLDLIGFIIAGKSINPDFLISSFMNMIQRAHRRNPENDYYMKILAIESMMLYMFLNELNLIKGVDKMNIGTFDEEHNEKDFFEVYGEFIDRPDKKASFLMGILTKKLTSTQYMALGSTPFMTKLWGMSLDQKKIQKLYPMLINKLREYKKAYVDLEEQISINFLESSKNWNLSRDETSFYFVLGFTLGKIFQLNKNEKGDKDE